MANGVNYGGGASLRLEDDRDFLLSILDSVALIAAPAVLAGADGRAICAINEAAQTALAGGGGGRLLFSYSSHSCTF